MVKTPTLLVILDGFGYRAESSFNAIANAHTPHFHALRQEALYGLIDASAAAVGLPKGQMGNSEVGHMNIGGGRKPQQVITRINTALDNDREGRVAPGQTDGTLESVAYNPPLLAFIEALKQSGGACHLLGICSDGRVHGDAEHVVMLASMIAAAGVTVWIHVITDGRDTAPSVAREQLGVMQQQLAGQKHVHFASIGGRAFAMDRDKNWDRTRRAYEAIVEGIGFDEPDLLSAIDHAYARGEADEDMQPAVLAGYEKMMPEDGLLMTNFRPDRARQIMAALTMDIEGEAFPLTLPKERILGMANYWDEAMPLDIPAMFDMEILPDTLGETLAKAGKTQLRIAETEKYAHVTSFFSGNNPTFDGEARILVPSPKVASYDMQPHMSAPEVTEKLLAAIASDTYDCLIVNYANPDMVGHTGNYDAAVQAIEAVDDALGQLRAAIAAKGGHMLITADHGNADNMRSADGLPDKKHTTNPVPFIVDSPDYAKDTYHIREGGALQDIAPTVLALMKLDKPAAMTGESLIAP